MAEEGVHRFPAVSPCRRDYQLRSLSSHASEWDSASRPQSPWLPRSQSQQRAEEMMSPFRLYESSAGAGPTGRPSSRSGPLPAASRAYGYGYGSPLPNPSPLPSYFSGASVAGLGSPTRGSLQSSTFAQRLPSLGGESEEAADVSFTSRSTSVSASPTNFRRRNSVSAELGRSCEAAQARKCKSGDILSLEIRADGIFPIPESRQEEPKRNGVRKHSPPESILWEALNDAESESPRREVSSSAIVPVPFKWEEASSPSGKVSDSPSSTEVRISVTGHHMKPAVGAVAVPFKWEVAPGKPKFEEKLVADAPPALQLPPRLSSAASLKRNSWSSSSPPPFRARSLSASVSTSVVKLSGKQHSRRSIDEPPSPSTPQAPRPRAISGALSPFGTPQYQCADYSFCEDSSSRIRSPTSTLCGPGTPSTSSSSSSSSRKPTHSVESFDHWSYGDHTTSTSRHSCAESQSEDSVRGHEDVDPVDGAIVKLRRKLTLKSAKPPRSPRITPSRHGYSFQGEEYFDCQAHVSSSPALAPPPPSDTEEEAEPATRLPYKMPSPALPDVEPSSPTRDAPEFANCLALPRFLSKGESAPSQWLENPSLNVTWDAPASSVLEDGYRSPAYKATLEMFSPSADLLAKRSMKLRSSSVRRRHPHLVEVLCNSLKQSLQRCTKRSVTRTHSIVLYDDQFTKEGFVVYEINHKVPPPPPPAMSDTLIF